MTIVRLFEDQVARTPHAIAVKFEAVALTYEQLNDRANQLANHLRIMGVGREQMVGLLLERSPEMVIAILGVLKAGGAYVPLDPDYPFERLAFMLKDTRVPVLLTQTHIESKVPIDDLTSLSGNMKVISLDSGWEEIAGESTENNPESASLEDLAYTIYTSGSTGQPKGVMNEHRGVYNRMIWMLDAFPLAENDRVVQKTPYSFDVSIYEFFWPLLSGACLVVSKPGGHKDSEYLINLIIEHNITAIHFVPSMLQVFLLNEGVQRCRTLRRVICSGEALSYELQQRFFSILDAELINLYGPTEAAIEVTCWICQRDGTLNTVPIGRPLPNVQIHVLDSDLRPVPVGEQGELHIGGIQVARGYLNRPDLTAERFINDPFSNDPNSRLYKTGDLASFLPDGTILYHGRMDHQVKIRGNRVELGEIEAVLVSHVEVREAVVTAYDLAPGDKRLAAYIVPEAKADFQVGTVREFLATRLPEYMIPASFVLLNSLPLTPSGKVDRKALPAPDRARPKLDESYAAPRNEKEEVLVRIWQQVIGLDQVGIHDNFLELGGDSILSIQIASLANQAGVQIKPGQVMEYQTVAELATVADTTPIVRAEQGLVTGLMPLTPGQKQFFDYEFREPSQWCESIVLKIPRELEASLLEKAIRHLLAHHDALRLRFTRDGTTWRPSIAVTDDDNLFSHVKYHATGVEKQKTVMLSIIAELETSLDISDGPMLKGSLIDFEPGTESYFVLVVHHLVVDGMSWRILLAHLDILFRQLIQGQPLRLPPKTSSVKVWSLQLNDLTRSRVLKHEVPMWIAMHDEQMARLPVDSPDIGRDTNNVPSIDSLTVSLSVEDTHALMVDVPKAYRTLVTDVLLTALAQVFTEWTGMPAFQVDIEGHGREPIFKDVDLSMTVGSFSAIYPVLLSPRSTIDAGDSLISIKEILRQIPQGGIGYGLLRYLDLEENTSRLQELPSSEAIFQYMGRLDAMLPDDSLLELGHDFPFIKRILAGQRGYKLEISSGIVKNRLHIAWVYDRNSNHPETVKNLANGYMDSLVSLIKHCVSTSAVRYSPSDFPEAGLSQQELDELLSEFDEYEE
jgi:amino acid adenylation domain-containing protein/non-ribosomal peptide synthase protein (TIGR01720 family)